MPRLPQWPVLTLLVIGLGWSSTASAQVQPAPNPPPPRPAATGSGAAAAAEPSIYPSIPATALLSMASVQDELRMTALQKQQFRSINDPFNRANQSDMAAVNQLQQGQEAQYNQIQDRIIQRQRIFERQVQQLLQPSQMAMLQQIAFHLSVAQALPIPQIEAQIRLTSEQKQRVQQIHAAAADKYFQIQRQVAEQLLQSLSREQQQVLQALNAQAVQGGGR